MDHFPDEIVEHYDREIDEGRRITQGLGQLELLRTREIVRRHLPPAPRRILDVGGGTGVHAAWLASDGHDVHLIDRVPRHVDQARRLAPGPGRVTAAVGDARDLAAARASFDAVLLLGPLYHLTERADRIRVLREAARVVRPAGVVFAAAVSRFASLFDGLEVLELVGVEGLAGFLPRLDRRWERDRDRELILWSARVVEAEPSLLGLSAHLLVVARPALP
jgi:SAM-dependent methyltransferase